MTTTLFGIPNCDTVKKARNWMDEHHLPYAFCDLRNQGVSGEELIIWGEQVGWDKLINKRSTSFRQLNDDQKIQLADPQSAITLLIEIPTLIKRPVIKHHDQIHVGFDPQLYATIFAC